VLLVHIVNLVCGARNFSTSLVANKALVLTAPALTNFGIIARPNRLGGSLGFILPHTARERRHNAGVK
jgi:hypothetical protein